MEVLSKLGDSNEVLERLRRVTWLLESLSRRVAEEDKDRQVREEAKKAISRRQPQSRRFDLEVTARRKLRPEDMAMVSCTFSQDE